MSETPDLHVLHVNSGVDPRQGGPTTAMLAMIAAQVDVGLRVSVASTFGRDFKPDAAEQMRRAGAEVHLIGPSTHVLAWHRDIKPTLRRLIAEADIVHVHALWEEIQHQAAVISRKLGKPYVFTPHGMLDPWGLSQSRLKKKLYLALRLRRDLNRAAAIHFTDETERDLAAPLKLTAPAIVERLIIDLSDFDPPPPRGQFRAKFASQLGDGDRPILLFMSRIHPKKGLDLLIPAFAQLRATQDATLVIAGPDIDGYQAKVEAMVREHNVADRVLFAGMLYGRDRAAALVDADLFVLPSYQENFGVVVIESLAVGTPVIISDQVNIHRHIGAAGVGDVVAPRADELSLALELALGDHQLRHDAATRAPEFVRTNYDRTTIARRWVEHYQRLIASAPR